jgi:hypothetical protein
VRERERERERETGRGYEGVCVVNVLVTGTAPMNLTSLSLAFFRNDDRARADEVDRVWV